MFFMEANAVFCQMASCIDPKTEYFSIFFGYIAIQWHEFLWLVIILGIKEGEFVFSDVKIEVIAVDYIRFEFSEIRVDEL